MANFITVSALNNYLKRKFEADIHLGHVYLKGEISNCKIHSRGHIYFSLKDETSVISAIMFEQDARKLNFKPEDGAKVFAEGRVTVYEGSGKYQIVVSKMQPDGIGELYIAYEKLKKELEKEGLFRDDLKKPIPKYPKKIGIVTAPTGAAIRDILSTIKRRFPIAQTILFPTLVQGDGAKTSIANQIERAQNYDLDVLIIGRGGGSIEDLWSFNEEIVARAIFASTVPVISAVGHEVDFTIADFVADFRAPTPTGAAEIAVPNMVDVFELLENYKIRLMSDMMKRIELATKRLDTLKNAYVLKSPLALYEVKEQKLSGLIVQLENYMTMRLKEAKSKFASVTSSYVFKNPLALYDKEKERLDFLKSKLTTSWEYYASSLDNRYGLLLNKLELLSPLGVLKKGYSFVTKKGLPISSIEALHEGDRIDIRLDRGSLEAEVKKIVKED